ncbi:TRANSCRIPTION REPRESSOR OFP14 [Salix viminalis]|uniref:Transcription repressor n=1 Tax=Salix viminalis TaxID=40686 RepID=A0A9Q0YYV9_SALVM|nr:TRANSCRIPTION REPRESSOR OFP14 [Salix viminalis]
MPKKLQKSLQDYIYKIKNPAQNIQISSNSFSNSRNWIFRGCKHPRTLSFAIAGNQSKSRAEEDEEKRDAATLSDVDRFLFENFRSLYINDDDGNFPEGKYIDPPLDLCGSHRFFVEPGSSSGSLVEEARSSLTVTSENMGSTSTSTSTSTVNEDAATADSNDPTPVRLPDDCIAVLAYSPSPYDDFRQSMQQMVEEKLQNNGIADWDFMEELLQCYLRLNEKTSHKFILSAFVDLIVGLRKNEDKVPVRSRHSRTARSEGRRKYENVT